MPQTELPTDPYVGGGYSNSNSSSSSTYGTSGTLGSRGLYQQVTPPRQSQAAGIQGSDNRAYTRTVTGDELVQNQMRGLMNRGGAYMQNAAQRGLETANRRGLLNSSIASGSAERASLEAAMPIAQADAQTYGRTQSENMGALNQGLMQERDIMNAQTLEGMRQSQQGSALAMQERLANQQMQLDLQRQREGFAFEGEMQGLNRAQQQAMAQFGLGADLTRAQQGFGYDMNRMQTQMGLQDYYDSRQGQRDMQRDMQLAEFGAGLNVMNRFYGNFADDFFTNPEVYADPAIRDAVLGFGTQFRPRFMTTMNSFYGI